MRCANCYGVFNELQDGKCPICRGVKNAPTVVPVIPSVEDVAGQGTDAVQQVPAPVASPDQVKKHQPFEYDDAKSEAPPTPPASAQPKRQPVDHMTANLYWPFIIMMGRIAKYAQDKYGSVEQYADGRLEGEKSPINHIAGHIAEYVRRKPHDRFGTLQMQLAAIAYNAMMECVYLDQGGGPTVPGKLYTKGAE